MTTTPDKPIIQIGLSNIDRSLVDPIVGNAFSTYTLSRLLLAAVENPDSHVNCAISTIDHDLLRSQFLQEGIMDRFERKWNWTRRGKDHKAEQLAGFNTARANFKFMETLIKASNDNTVIELVRKTPKLYKVALALAKEVTHRMSGGHLDILRAVNEVAVIKFPDAE